MSKLDKDFLKDRQMRDSARAVLLSDVAHAKNSFSAKGVAERVGGRIGDGAKDVFEVAKTHSDDKRGIIAALIGAVLLWFARDPILEILGVNEEQDEEAGVPKAEPESEPNPSVETASPADITPPGDDDEQ